LRNFKNENATRIQLDSTTKMKIKDVCKLLGILGFLSVHAHADEWIDSDGNGSMDTYQLDVMVVTPNGWANQDTVALPTFYVTGTTGQSTSDVEAAITSFQNLGAESMATVISGGEGGTGGGGTVSSSTSNGISLYKTTFSSTSTAKAVTYNASTVQTHSTGWQSVTASNDPATWLVFSGLKAGSFTVATSTATAFLGGLGISAAAQAALETGGGAAAIAAALGPVGDMIDLQFKVDGKSVEGSPWYGSVDTRLTWTGLETVILFDSTGPAERYLIESSVTYRVTFASGAVYEFSPDTIPGSQNMNDFLANQAANGFKTHDEVK
jgi:hypothetical protein